MKKLTGLLILVSIFVLRIAIAEVDWEKAIIRVSDTNQSRLSLLLRDELYALQYDDYRTVGEFLRSNFDRESRLVGLLNEYHRPEQHYLTDGSIEYMYQLPMTNKVMALLLPETKPVKLVVPMLCPSCGQEWPHGKPIPENTALVPKQIETIEYTGIVIDCRDFKINPCLFPKIYNEMSEEIYSVNFADLNHVVEAGLVVYSTSDSNNNSRIGYNPLRIRAIGVMGNKRTDIKISSLDARRIHGSNKNLQLLKECHVAIIFAP